MGRTITFNDAANTFVQGGAAQNVAVRLFLRGGNDKVSLNRSDDLGGRNFADMGAGNDTITSVKEDGNEILLGNGNDIYASIGFGSFASERADTVRGGNGDDQILVTTFKSMYFGGNGRDKFVSHGWQNRFDGGSGIDVISYEFRNESSSLAGTGVSVDLASGRVQTGRNRIETVISVENVIGSPSDDVLAGTAGANRLAGGGGFDVLAGRGGADVFVWRRFAEAPVSDENIDVILDFSRAQGDRIDLSNIDARQGAGNDAFVFIGGSEFSGRKGELRYADRTGVQDLTGDGRPDFLKLLSGDINGDGAADFQIAVVNFNTLRAADFLL